MRGTRRDLSGIGYKLYHAASVFRESNAISWLMVFSKKENTAVYERKNRPLCAP